MCTSDDATFVVSITIAVLGLPVGVGLLAHGEWLGLLGLALCLGFAINAWRLR